METFAVDWLVLAQTTETSASAFSAAIDSLRGFATVAIIALVLFGLPILLARWLTRSVFRMGDDYAWRFALVLSTVFCAVAIIWPTGILPKSEKWRGWPPKMGIDLQGGVILVYEMVDQSAVDPTNPEAAAARINVEDLVDPLRRRLDPGGIKEIVVRPYGQRQIEIIIPEVEAGEVEQVKKTISTAGHLQFRILVDAMLAQDERHVNAALDEANRKKDLLTVRVGDKEEPLAQWMRVARDDRAVRIQAVEVPDPKDPSKTIKIDEIRPLKFYPTGGNIVRDAETFEIVNLPYVDWEENKRTHQFERNMLERGIGELEVLVRMDDRFNVEGGDLEYATSGYDDRGGNAVHFNMTARGAQKMARLTSTHLPTSDHKYQMGIILDDEVLSAPTINDTISDRGMISGSFTDQEVTFLVRILQGGRLPASLNKSPISENRIDPLLGEETIRRSMISMGLALLVTLAFIVFWYRAAGVVASVALLLNLIFTLALLVLFSVALSLPGVAGLVLSVGMSVDANILIFERMREERLKGSSFRLAIRNGFSRASTTIIDSNLTTLITAFVLYFIGTDQIKGFAITLILGILTSMFTAIFVAKLIFEVCERRGWMKDIYAFGAIQKYLVERGFDFVRVQTVCVILSVVLGVVSIGLAAARGSGIFDIDFNGGTSVTMLLREGLKQEAVDEKLAAKLDNVSIDGSRLDWNLVQIGVSSNDAGAEGDLTNRLYKVDSSFQTVAELKAALAEAMVGEDGKPLLQSYSMSFTAPEQTTKTVPVRAAATDDAEIEVDVTEDVTPETPATGATTPAAPGGTAVPGETGAPTTGETPATTTPETPAGETPAEPAPTPEEATPEETAPATPEGTEPSTEEPAAPATPEPGSSSGLDVEPSYFASTLLQEEQPATETAPAAETAPEAPATGQPAADTSAAETPAAPVRPTFSEPEGDTPAAGTAAGGAASAPAAPATREVTISSSKVTMANRISAQALTDSLLAASQAAGVELAASDIDLTPIGDGAADWNVESQLPFSQWNVAIEADSAQTLAVLEKAEQAFASDFVFPSSSEIGGQVAGKTKTMAAFAMLFSAIGIVLYIWFRFQKVVYGIAAVAALVHDVVITLGAVAASYWLARYVPGMNFLGIEEFKISLPVIAAFLTLMGYSLNDTIVVFDRIREVRGKAPYLTPQMINLSVNSTLSRTLLTSVTTFLSIVILFYLGGEGIHAFSFCLIIGILVGTYSSIFIAAPILLWMSQKAEAPTPSGKKKPAPKTT